MFQTFFGRFGKAFLGMLLAISVAAAIYGCVAQSFDGRPVSRNWSDGDTATSPGSFSQAPSNGVPVPSKISFKDGRAMAGESALPSRDEELWVIEKPSSEAVPPLAGDDQQPGSGVLMATPPGEQTLTPVPLKHTDVKASVAGYIATVEVTQRFQNPYDGKIEAVYVFPLPHNAAVNEFVMTVGQRTIRGIIRQRQEAERIYNAAKSQGYVASLLTQERPNIFTQSVANVEPGKAIDISIRYFHTLAYVDGWYEFVFPMVVGPRFHPSGSSQGVGAVPRGQPGTSHQAAEVQYLRPSERSGHDISLSLHIAAGVKIEEVQTRTHQVSIKNTPAGQAEIVLDDKDSIPNRDFVLRYKVAGQAIKSCVMVQRDPKRRDGKSGYFTLMLYPPQSLADLPRKPLEMVFTIDVSGSQTGAPLAQEKTAVRYALTHMGPQDTFQVIRFGNTAEKLFANPVPANEQYVAQALRYVDALEAGGGTMLVDGVHASLLFPHDPKRLRFVAFMTDGFIGNDEEALREVHNCLDQSRIFSFGVGSSTNRYLLEGMARMGNGAAAFLGLHDDANEVMGKFFERISHPAMTDISVDFGTIGATEVFPQRLGDLFVGRPVTITGRYSGDGRQTIRVHGNIGNEAAIIEIPVDLNDASATRDGIAAVWARTKLADLADRSSYEAVGDLAGQIRQVALEYGLISSFTAFVAVDASAKTTGDHGTTVGVPAPVPEGVRYATTVIPNQQ